MHQEGGHLHLADVVEGRETDVSVGEGLGGSLDLTQHLARVVAAEHRQLPHRPVPEGAPNRSQATTTTTLIRRRAQARARKDSPTTAIPSIDECKQTIFDKVRGLREYFVVEARAQTG